MFYTLKSICITTQLELHVQVSYSYLRFFWLHTSIHNFFVVTLFKLFRLLVYANKTLICKLPVSKMFVCKNAPEYLMKESNESQSLSEENPDVSTIIL